MASETHRVDGTVDFEGFAERISELTDAQVHAQVLFVASRAAIFDLLEEPRSAGYVARRLAWSERGTRFFLNALVGLGLLRRVDGDYENTRLASVCLRSDSQNCQGDVIRHADRCSRAWERLEVAVRNGHGLYSGVHPGTSEELDCYARAMYVIGLCGARDTFRCLDLEAPRRMLDLGGGAGAYTLAALRLYPELHVTLFDRPAVAAMAREHLREAELAERCQVVGGDLRGDSIGADYDVVLLSNVLHGQNSESNRALVQRCYEATTPGGILVVRDFLMGSGDSVPGTRQRVESDFGALFSLHLLVHTDGGRTYGVEEVSAWCTEAGYMGGRLLVPGRKARLWVVRRPG